MLTVNALGRFLSIAVAVFGLAACAADSDSSDGTEGATSDVRSRLPVAALSQANASFAGLGIGGVSAAVGATLGGAVGANTVGFGAGPVGTTTTFGTGPVGFTVGTGPMGSTTSFNSGPVGFSTGPITTTTGGSTSVSSSTNGAPVISTTCIGLACP